MRCDFCDEAFQEPSVAVSIAIGAGRRFGLFCSRFCAVHALVASISLDLADGAAPREWVGGELVVVGAAAGEAAKRGASS